MTKWIPRLIGVLVILVLGLFVASTWFSPPVPDALQRDLDLQVQGQPGQTPGQLRPVPQQELEPLVPDVPPPANAPTLTLTSLEDIPEEGSAPPVLTNPQPDVFQRAEADEGAVVQAHVGKGSGDVGRAVGGAVVQNNDFVETGQRAQALGQVFFGVFHRHGNADGQGGGHGRFPVGFR